jgi:hypothetical protein
VAMPSSVRGGGGSHLKVKPRPARQVKRPATRKVVAPSAGALIHELGSCATEADLIQVLYRGLSPRFGYEAINLHVLERGGWYHSLAIDSGVLQDVRRRPLRESAVAKQYANPTPTILPGSSKAELYARGPGAGRHVRFAIWVRRLDSCRRSTTVSGCCSPTPRSTS